MLAASGDGDSWEGVFVAVADARLPLDADSFPVFASGRFSGLPCDQKRDFHRLFVIESRVNITFVSASQVR